MRYTTTSFFLMLIVLPFAGCNKDDDTGNAEVIELSGEYQLTTVSDCFAADILNYNPGQVIWKFNNNDNTLEIENNILTTGPEQICAGLSIGTYTYELMNAEGAMRFFADDFDFGVISLVSGGFTLDHSDTNDGAIRRFIK